MGWHVLVKTGLPFMGAPTTRTPPAIRQCTLRRQPVRLEMLHRPKNVVELFQNPHKSYTYIYINHISYTLYKWFYIQKPRQLMDSCDRLMIKASRKPLTFSRSHSFRPLCCWLGCDYWCWRCRRFSILNAFCCWAGGGQHMQIDSAKCLMIRK